MRETGLGLVWAEDIDQSHGVGGRLDLANVDLIEPVEMVEDLAQLLAEQVLFFWRELEPGQVRHVLHVECRHGWSVTGDGRRGS